MDKEAVGSRGPARLAAASLLVLAFALTAPACRKGGEAGGDEPREIFDPATVSYPYPPDDPYRFEPPPAAGEGTEPYARDYEFSEDWFTRSIPVWEHVLRPLRGQPGLSYLEVGVFEGRSALWMLENVLSDPASRLTGIDIFPGDLEERYLRNLELSGFAAKATTINGSSQVELRKLPDESFDIIYIDGSHSADDVLADAVLAWELLKVGGLLLLDDYWWVGPDDSRPFPEELRPGPAIDAFVTAYRNEIEVIHRHYQVVLRKKRNPCRWKWDCVPMGQYVYEWRDRALYRQEGYEAVEISEAEAGFLERLIASRRFGETWFSPDPALEWDPGLRDMLDRLDLRLDRGPAPPL
jgi:predicted O-methyltransferase YrrM